MTKAIIRKKLIGKIKNVEDKNLLEELMRLLDMETDETEYKTSEEQQTAIKEARRQYKKNEYLSDMEADRDIDQWLEE
jgi:hypothetical protein